jgi:ketosteroid isomerase-like protein
MTDRLTTAKAYEAALFAGRMDEVGEYFTDDVVYWIAGAPPIGGEWYGREAVVNAFVRREFGLGDADWGYEEVWRDWYEADERVIVEIRERSWLKSAPDDVVDQRTCVIIRFRGSRISEMRDYADSHVYETFRARHRELR